MLNTNETKVINRGTGAGGSNTNATGLKFEACTELNLLDIFALGAARG